MTQVGAVAQPAKPVRNRNILLYGETGAGKTPMVGELAEYIYKTEQKKTRLYTSDRGGLETIVPYIDLGIIETQPLVGDPWIWLHKAARGFVFDPTRNKWVDGKRDDIGLYAFEGLTSIADALMQNLAKKAADGVNIGGGGNINFTVADAGESIKVGGNNQSHYGVVQTRITEEVWESQKLPGWLMWTATLSRDPDQSTAQVLGPQIAGKALTGEVPRWFVYTFRITVIPPPAGSSAKERHILYLGSHQDQGAGAKGMANMRRPLDADPLTDFKVEPASIVKAIQMADTGREQARDRIKARLGMK